MPDVLSASQLADERAAHRAELAVAIDQRDAWAARYTDLATAVLEGVYLNYDVKEDSGGSSFLCTCEHDGDGWPHEEWCGALLTSTLGADGEAPGFRYRAETERGERGLPPERDRTFAMAGPDPRSVSVYPAATSTREAAQRNADAPSVEAPSANREKA